MMILVAIKGESVCLQSSRFTDARVERMISSFSGCGKEQRVSNGTLWECLNLWYAKNDMTIGCRGREELGEAGEEKKEGGKKPMVVGKASHGEKKNVGDSLSAWAINCHHRGHMT